MTAKSSLFLAFLVFTVACGDSDGGGGGGSGGGAPVLTVAGSVDVTGDAVAKGLFEREAFSSQPSCAIWASEGTGNLDPGPEGTFLLPAPFLAEPLEPSGQTYNSTVRIEPEFYDGPGTYVNDGNVTQITGKIVIGNLNNSPQYFPEDGLATVTVNADGSGSFEFTDVPEVVEGLLQISGTVDWTCDVPEVPIPPESE